MPNSFTKCALVLFGVGGILQAGTISFTPLTDDASSGISTSVAYTHTISGGNAATVNGVAFETLAPTITPANFNWDTGSSGQTVISSNNGDWVPVTGGVTGPGLQSLLAGFTYSGTFGGGNPGSSQTFSLTGLTVGETYDTRLYIRIWDTAGSGRPIDLSFTHGAETDSAGTILEDRPSLVLGSGNDQQAYYVNYNFTAQATQLDITAAVPAGAAANSGSAHLYALSNQVAIPEPSSLALALLGMLGLLHHRRS